MVCITAVWPLQASYRAEVMGERQASLSYYGIVIVADEMEEVVSAM